MAILNLFNSRRTFKVWFVKVDSVFDNLEYSKSEGIKFSLNMFDFRKNLPNFASQIWNYTTNIAIVVLVPFRFEVSELVAGSSKQDSVLRPIHSTNLKGVSFTF